MLETANPAESFCTNKKENSINFTDLQRKEGEIMFRQFLLLVIR